MAIRKLTNGHLFFAPPRYDTDFRAEMHGLGSWITLRTPKGEVSGYTFLPEQRPAVEALLRQYFPEALGSRIREVASLPATVLAAIGVVASDGQTYAAIADDGDVAAVIAAIKAIPGRQWREAEKVWVINYLSAADLQRELGSDIQFVPASRLLDAEIAAIGRAQTAITANREALRERVAALDVAIAGFAFNSASNAKAALLRERGRILGALESAALPVDQLTEPQIRGLLAAAREDI